MFFLYVTLHMLVLHLNIHVILYVAVHIKSSKSGQHYTFITHPASFQLKSSFTNTE